MRLLLLATLLVCSAALREKRTIGVIFRGLVDAHTRTTPPPKKGEDGKPEKVRGPPPATVYLIPVPERDKKTEQQLLNAALALRANATRYAGPPTPVATQPTSTTESPEVNRILQAYQTKYPPASVDKRNATLPPKQFVIRIGGDDGKAIMVRITGDDVKVKKSNEGYSIGVNGHDTRANIRIEVPEKTGMRISEKPFYIPPNPNAIPYSSATQKVQESSSEKGRGEGYPIVQRHIPFSPFAAYPYYFHPALNLPGPSPYQPLPPPAALPQLPPTTPATTVKPREEQSAPHVQVTLRLKDENDGKPPTLSFSSGSSQPQQGRGYSQSSTELQGEGYSYQRPEIRYKDPSPIKYQQLFLQPPEPQDPPQHQYQQSEQPTPQQQAQYQQLLQSNQQAQYQQLQQNTQQAQYQQLQQHPQQAQYQQLQQNNQQAQYQQLQQNPQQAQYQQLQQNPQQAQYQQLQKNNQQAQYQQLQQNNQQAQGQSPQPQPQYPEFQQQSLQFQPQYLQQQYQAQLQQYQLQHYQNPRLEYQQPPRPGALNQPPATPWNYAQYSPYGSYFQESISPSYQGFRFRRRT